MVKKSLIVILFLILFFSGTYTWTIAIAEDLTSNMEGQLTQETDVPNIGDRLFREDKISGPSVSKDPLGNITESGSTEYESFHAAPSIVSPGKGESEAEEIFDPRFCPPFHSDNDLDIPKKSKGEVWNDILWEDFEGIFPSGLWAVYGNPTWDDDDFKPYAGNWSAWCANGGSAGLDPAYNNYANNMEAWAIYGPFDLSDAENAYWSFYHWTDVEYQHDYFKYMVSLDGTHFYGYQYTGNSGGWISRTIDLTNVPTLGNVCGKSQVWVAFLFKSDSSGTKQGTFIDNVRIRKNVPPQFDLIMEDVYMRDQPGDAGNIVINPAVGQKVYIHYRYRCEGSGTTPPFRRESKIDGSVWSYTEGVTANGGYTYTVWSTNPWTVTPGAHTIYAKVDVNNTVPESNENNNHDSYTFTPISQFDLIMEDVYMRDQPGDAGNIVINPAVGQKVYIHYRYRCEGSGTTPPFRRESKIDGSVWSYTEGVTANGGYTYTVWSTNPWTVTPGAHTIYAKVDVNNTVPESNENNNHDSYTFTAQQGEPIIRIEPTSLNFVQ